MKVLITPKSFTKCKNKVYPILQNAGFEIIENPFGRTLNEDEIIELAEDVEGIIVGIDPITEKVLKSAKKLKAISKYGVGLDNIDLKKAEELGIKVKNAIGSNNVSVAEFAIALMFEVAKKISVLNKNVKQGKWERVLGFELTGKTIGIIGCGNIGKEVAKRCKGLFMNVLIYDPYFSDYKFLQDYNVINCNSLRELLSESDIVSLHLPLNEQTKHVINIETLRMMKPNAVLINTSRGELIDEDSLYIALKEKIIAFAAQDVFSKEPPEKDEKLLTLENFLLTPHAAAYTAEAIEKMATISTLNLIDMLN